MTPSDNRNNKRIKIEDIDNQVNFDIPEGYFDKLPAIIQSRIIEETGKQNIFHTLKKSFTNPFKLGIGIATATCIVLAFYYLKPETKNQNGCYDLACIPVEEIKSYYSEQQYLLEEEDIIDAAIDNYEELDLKEFEMLETTGTKLNTDYHQKITPQNSPSKEIIIEELDINNTFEDEIELEEDFIDELELEDLNDLI